VLYRRAIPKDDVDCVEEPPPASDAQHAALYELLVEAIAVTSLEPTDVVFPDN
jgi:hypothetical protein